MPQLASILLVDDDPITNFLNERLLRRLEVAEQLWVVETARAALTLLAQPETAAPSLLLLDVNMPGMTGIEFLDHYHAQRQAQASATVVLMLTTSMDARDLGRLPELGIDGLVSKPLTEEKIETILQLHFPR